jgi:hypothetical protein
LKFSHLRVEELKYVRLFLMRRALVQYYYFAYRIDNNITQGLSEDETNLEGFEDGINFVEATENLPSDYFYKIMC